MGELERQGFLERAPDPADGRAALARFTPAGERLLADAIAVTRETEAQYTVMIGADRLAALCAAFSDLVGPDGTRPRPSQEPPAGPERPPSQPG